MRLLPAALLAALLSTPAAAQSVPDLVTRGVAAFDARNPVAALKDYQAAMAIDSTSYEANWRASVAASSSAVCMSTSASRTISSASI